VRVKAFTKSAPTKFRQKTNRVARLQTIFALCGVKYLVAETCSLYKDTTVIQELKDSNAHLASTWTAGIALLFITIGLGGAVRPLTSPQPKVVTTPEVQEVMLEEFTPPAAAPTAEAATEPEKEAVIEDVEIPPLPEITQPLTIPEMADITPLETVLERPPAPKPKAAEPQKTPQRPSQPQRSTATQTPPRTNSTTGSGSSQATDTSGSGTNQSRSKGYFPPPSYPASARSAKLQGSVLVQVTVEASGSPTSVSIAKSSGHAVLDSAARDTVQRRWRWPAGGPRRFTVNVRFQLK
jgi:protein TonB